MNDRERNDAVDTSDFDALVDRYFEGTLSDTETDRLLDAFDRSPELKRRFMETADLTFDLTQQLRWDSAAKRRGGDGLPRVRRFPPFLLRFVAVAATLVAAVAVAVLILLQSDEEPAFRVTAVRGTDVELSTVSGAIQSLKVDSLVRKGEAVRTGTGSEVELSDGYGIRMQLREHGSLRYGRAGSSAPPCMVLESGWVNTEATHRSRECVLATALCEVRVTGTKFGVQSAASFSRVAVTEGAVNVRRNADMVGCSVKAGELLTVAATNALGPVPWAGHEFASSFGGVFFRDAAANYERNALNVDAHPLRVLSRRPIDPKTLSVRQVSPSPSVSSVRGVDMLAVVTNLQGVGAGVLVQNLDGPDMDILVELPETRSDSFGVEFKMAVQSSRIASNAFDCTRGMYDFTPDGLPESLLNGQTRAWHSMPERGGTAFRMEYRRVGTLPDNRPIYEYCERLADGRSADAGWVAREPTVMEFRVKGMTILLHEFIAIE